MSQPYTKPPTASTLATVVGCSCVFGSLLLTLAFPRLHLGVAIAIGAVTGAPFIALGLLLHSRSISRDSKQFLPTITETQNLLWGGVAWAVFFVSLLAPVAIFGVLGYLLPPGDDWGMVALRLLFISVVCLVCYRWVKFVSAIIPGWFRGRVSDQTLDAMTRQEPRDEPKSRKAAALKYFHLVIIALVTFCIACGAIHFPDIKVGPRRIRGLIGLIQWCRGNPNTVTASAGLVGAGALVLYFYRIYRASVKASS